MPYTPEFTEHFLEVIQSRDNEVKKRVIAELKAVLSLEDPTERGGEYMKKWWAYPFSSCSAFICELKSEDQRIIFRDIIFKL